MKRMFAVGLVLALGLLYVLLNTSLGVWFAFDVLGDLGGEERDFNPPTGPLEFQTALRPVTSSVLPRELEQPSGVTWDARRGAFLVGTDQSELFELETGSGDPQTGGLKVRSHMLVRSGLRLLRQGKVECLELLGPDELVVGGELGGLLRFERVRESSDDTSSVWREVERFAEDSVGSFDLQGLAFAPGRGAGGELFVSGYDGETIVVMDREGALKRTLNVRAGACVGPSCVKLREAAGGLSALILSGLTWSGDTLVAVTQNHSSLLEIQPDTGEILRGFALEGIADASDLTVTHWDGASGALQLAITGDHNLFDPRPPLWEVVLPGR